MTENEVRAILAAQCEAAGGQAAWARAHGVSPAYVSDVLTERRDPGKAVLDALGLERVVDYRRKAPSGTQAEGDGEQ